MVHMVRRNHGPELDFFLSLYFASTQVVTDARSSKHAQVTIGYFEFLWMFEVEVLFVHCLDKVF
jgi:hypothetical protein